MPPHSPHRLKPGTQVDLGRISTHAHDGFPDKEAAEAAMLLHREQLAELQDVFYAAQSHALLIVLQGMDTAGKDGVIRHIFSGINPQGCDVSSFKVPTPEEARHDFLWRCQKQTPARGMIGVFNRSHYEDVLAPAVHGLIDKKTVRRRLKDIDAWEKTLTDNHTLVLKFFLHLSREEQTARLQARIDDPDKHWKLSPADFAERVFWPGYASAYEQILSRSNHKHAPWYIVPSDHKWYRNAAIGAILVECLRGLKLKYPRPAFDPAGLHLKKLSPETAARRAALLAEAAAG